MKTETLWPMPLNSSTQTLEENLAMHFRHLRVEPPLDITKGSISIFTRRRERAVIIPRVAERCFSSSPHCSLPRLHSKSKAFLLGGVNNLLILWNFNLSKSCGGGRFKMHQHARLGWSLLETLSALAWRWGRSTFFRNLQSLINCN